jgi:hypothetical protein
MDKMNCEKCSELLIEYIDGSLSPGETAFVRSHIEACPECLREYEDYTEIRRAVAETAAVPELSPETVTALARAAKKSISKDRKPFWKKIAFSPFLVPALSSAIALSVWFYYGNTGTHIPSGSSSSTTVMAKKVEPVFDGSGSESVQAAAPAVKRERARTPDTELRSQSYGDADAMTEQKAAAPAPPPAPMAAREDAAPAESGRMSAPRKMRNMEAPAGGAREEASALADSSDSEQTGMYSASSAVGEYDAVLQTALRQQESGDCASSIKTNEALLKSRPEPPVSVQAVSYKSLAECYEQKGEVEKAVYNYRQLEMISPAEAPYANTRISELKGHDAVAATPAPTVTPVN